MLLCNGDALGRATEVVGAEADGLTYGCLFFGVLSTGAAPTLGAGAPPTVVTGRHATAVAALIGSCGPRCDVVDRDALARAVRLKLVWSAALWLICARHGGDVVDAHAQPAARFDAASLRPRRDAIAATRPPRHRCDTTPRAGGTSSSSWTSSTRPSTARRSRPTPEVCRAPCRRRTSPSRSSPTETAFFCGSGRPQPMHERLLREVGVDPAELMTTRPRRPSGGGTLRPASAGARRPRGCPQIRRRRRRRGHGLRRRPGARDAPAWPSPCSMRAPTGDGVAGRRRLRGRDLGLVGLAQRQRQGREESGVRRTDQNQPGHVAPAGAVRRPRDLVGALLYADGEPQTAGGAYAVDVLSAEEAAAREPGLQTQGRALALVSGRGRADPAATVATLQQAAEAAGVTFRWGAKVDGLLPGGEGVRVDGDDMCADVAILAAGVGIPALGAPVPMKRSPGVLAHTQAKTEQRCDAGPAGRRGERCPLPPAK